MHLVDVKMHSILQKRVFPKLIYVRKSLNECHPVVVSIQKWQTKNKGYHPKNWEKIIICF